MDQNLVGKNALVCGSSKGIGKASAIMLAAMGANVTLVARNQTSLEKALGELDATKGQKHDFFVADFSKPEELKDILDIKTKEKDFHILINNTGGPAGGPIFSAKLSQFLSAFEMHLMCNHVLAQATIPGMKSSGYGRIINVISTSVKQPLNGLGVSNTIRGAVANWSKTLANEVGQFGITVNNVLPGATGTDRLQEIIGNKARKLNLSEEEVSDNMKSIIPMNRFARPSEIASAVAFLASPAASYITGINLPVDGGRTKSL